MSKLDEKQIEKTHKSAAGQEDKEFEEWVSQRVLDETAEMINGLENDPDLDDFEPSEELFQKIVGIAKERGLLAEDDETTEDEADEIVEKIELSDDVKEKVPVETIPAKDEIHNNENGKVVGFTHRKHMAVKWVAMLAVTLLGVFGVSMSSQANRTFVMQKVDEILDNGKNTVVNNSGKTIQDDNKDEEVDRKEIEEKFEVQLPSFFYIPDDMGYIDYSIDEKAQIAYLRYSYKKDIVCLMIMANYKDAVGISKNDQGEKIENVESDLSPISVELWKIEEEGDEKPTYVAQWEDQNALFEFVGKFEERDIKDIIKNIASE